MPPLDTLGAKLRAARIAAGMSLADVARAGVISASGLSLIERGERHPLFDTVAALAKLYGIRVTASPAGVSFGPHSTLGQSESP